MTKNEIEVGTRLILDQSKLAQFCKERRDDNDFFACSGELGASLYQTKLGTVIRNCDGYDQYGDVCYTYDLFVPARNVLVHFDECFVIESVGYATITLRSLDNENVSFWLDKDEFEQVDFIELD